jgi:16S rRNA (guanine966-N2)-methyltransferase
MTHLSILSGSFKGRLLKTPKGDATRPTTALLRKSVFDRLRPTIEDSCFLDLFAGTGAMGIEALSAGALCATFIESHKEALSCIKQNLITVKAENRSTVLNGDVLKILKRLKTSFDIIYADPPYEKADYNREILTYLDSSTILKPEGLVMLEEGAVSFSNLSQIALNHLQHLESRLFGKSILHTFVLRSKR